MKIIYLATNFRNWPSLLPVRDQIEGMGHVVHSRWLMRAETGLQSGDDPVAAAVEDMEDIRASELLILDTTNAQLGSQSGGLYVEMGYALGLGQRQVWLVGPETNIFTTLLQVRRFDTWDEALQALEVLWPQS